MSNIAKLAVNAFLLSDLTHVVRARHVTGVGGWETVAAFNVEAAALAYARDCANDRANFHYEVVEVVDPSRVVADALSCLDGSNSPGVPGARAALEKLEKVLP